MELELVVASTAVGGNILLGIGLAVTWLKNGRSQASKYGELQNEVKNTGEKVDSLRETVNEIDRKVDKFETHCAGISGRLDERVHTTERDIKELKRG